MSEIHHDADTAKTKKGATASTPLKTGIGLIIATMLTTFLIIFIFKGCTKAPSLKIETIEIEFCSGYKEITMKPEQVLYFKNKDCGEIVYGAIGNYSPVFINEKTGHTFRVTDTKKWEPSLIWRVENQGNEKIIIKITKN